MTPKEKEMLEAVIAYQKDVGKISKSVALAARTARKDLMSDAEKILETFRRKGGFATKAEAEAYLSQNITESERRVLIDRAKATYTGADLKRELTRLSSPAYRWRIDRKKAIGMTAKMCSDSLRDKIEGRIIDGVDSVVKEVSGRVNYSVQKQVGVALDWTLPNRRQLESVHHDIGVYDKVKLWSAGELEDARTRISEGILNGHSYDDISRRVSLDSGKEAYKARRLVRTTMAQASVDAEVKVLEDLGVEEYEIHCTLDERTCPICSKYDGKQYKMGKGPTPTFHPNCRCSITQVLPEEMRKNLRRAARNEDGRTIHVPGNMTYDQWREKYGPKTAVPAPKTPKIDTPKVEKPVESERTVPTRKREKIEMGDMGKAFQSSKLRKENTMAVLDHINSKEDADPNAVAVIKNLMTGVSKAGEFDIKYSSDSRVNITKYFSGKTKVILYTPKLAGRTHPDYGTAIHEMTHLSDLFHSKDGISFLTRNDKALIDAVEKTSPDMSEDITDLFSRFRKEHEAIRAEYIDIKKAEYEKVKAIGDATRGKTGKEYLDAYDRYMVAYKEYEKKSKALDIEADEKTRASLGGGVDMLQDIYDALSRGNHSNKKTVLYGHGIAYYNTISNVNAELIANYVSLSIERPDLIAKLRSDKPQLCRELDRIMHELGEKVDG